MPPSSDPHATIPFNDLRRGATELAHELTAAFERVLASGWFVMGPEHDAFQAELAEFVGVEHALAVGNGTDALQLALTGLGVAAGDHVLTAANAGGYTSAATELVGARPVYADVDATTHLLTPATLEAALQTQPQTPVAIVVTHLYGAMADMPAIMAWAQPRGIRVIEDCAQALGARRGGRRAGSYADAATTSFYPTKNLGGLGDGGAVFTPHDDVAERIQQQRQYGWTAKYTVSTASGRNSRLDELQAAILRVKLRHLDAWNERRREIHRRFESNAPSHLRVVNTSDDEAFIGHLAVVETAERKAVREHLARHGVHTDVHYPVPDHRQPLRVSESQPILPVTERLADSVLSLPLFPELTDEEVTRIADALAGAPQ